MENGRYRKRRALRRILRVFWCSVLVVVVLSTVSVAAYGNYLLSLMERPDPGAATAVMTRSSSTFQSVSEVTVVDEDDTPMIVELADKPAEDLLSDNTINILVTGQDRREDQERGRADVIVLCSFDTVKKTLTMVSFIRNTYLTIPGYSPDTMKMAFQYGNFDLLAETLNYNYGVHVDGNLSIDFYNFMEAVDYLGGLDIVLTAEEAKAMNRAGNLDILEHEKWDLSAGENHLDGNQTLAYARLRCGNGDISRIERHKAVLNALMEKIRSLGLLEMNELFNRLLPMISTDMNNQDIIGYAFELLPLLSECRIVTQQIPAEGTYKSATIVDTGEFLTQTPVRVAIPDLEENRRILSELLPQ